MAFVEDLGIRAVAFGLPEFLRGMQQMDKGIAGVGTRGESLSRQFASLGNSVIKFGSVLGTVVVGAAGAAAAALGGLAAIGIREAIQAEEVNARLEAVLAATGGAAGITAQKANELAFAYRDLAGGSDDAVKAAEAVLLRFKNIRGKAFEPALQITLDLAAALGVDAASAASQLGRALELPGEGLRALKAAGIILTDEQTELIDKLVETGQIAKAQDFLMKALAGSIGGTAARAAQTLSGQFTILKNHILEEAEAIGFILLPAFGRLLSGITPIIQQALPLLVELFRNRVGPAVERTVDFILNLVRAFADAGPFSIEFREALTGILPQDLQDRLTAFLDGIGEGFKKVRDVISENKDAIIGAIQAIGVALAGAAIFSIVLKIAGIITALGTPIGIILAVIGLLGAAWKTNFLGIQDTLRHFWETTGRPIFDSLLATLKEQLPKALQAASDFFEKTLLPAFASVASFWKTEGQPVFEQIVDFLSKNVPIAIEAARDFFVDKLIPGIAAVVSFIGQNFGPAITGIVDFFQPLTDGVSKIFDGIAANAPAVIDAFGPVIDFIKQTFGPTFAIVLNNVGIFLKNFVVLLGNLLGRLGEVLQSETFQKGFLGVVNTIAFAFRFVVGIVEIALAVITGAFAAANCFMAGDAQGFYNAVIGTIGALFNTALGIVGINLDEFQKSWDTAFTNIKVLVDIILGGIRDRISNAVENIKKFFGEDLRDSVSNALNALSDTVAELIGGIADKISEGLSGAIDSVKDLLGIHSRSKVFMDVGRQMMLGLAEGVAQAARFPIIATQNVAARVVSAPAASGAQRTTNTTNNMNLTVNSAAPSERVVGDFRLMAALGGG